MSSKYFLIIREVNAIFKQYNTKMTLRQVYYRLIAKHIIPNTVSQYKYLSKILVKAREDNEIKHNMIEDRVRTTIGDDNGWNNPTDFLTEIEEWFRKAWMDFTMPMWTNQPQRVEVWVEKDALSRLISEIAMQYKLRTCPSRGYSSYTYLKEAVERLLPFKDKEIVILYLGDYDPSGLDITRDLEERLSRYGLSGISIKRIALNLDQIMK